LPEGEDKAPDEDAESKRLDPEEEVEEICFNNSS
jgi:hypothetical protein